MVYVSISHVYREANMAADWLSKAGHSLLTTAVFWDSSFSQELSDILQADRIRRTLVRKDVELLLTLYLCKKRNKNSPSTPIFNMSCSPETCLCLFKNWFKERQPLLHASHVDVPIRGLSQQKSPRQSSLSHPFTIKIH